MKEETIHLTLYDDYFEIDVEFIFENRKRDQELILGFPVLYGSNIEKINVIVTNKSSHILSFISKSEEWLWIGDNELTYSFENVDPEYSDILTWGVESFINTNYSYLERFNLLRKGAKYDWDHKKDDLNYFTKKIKYLTKNQLRILRNAYYAIHGYKFASKDLQDIFSKCSWYKINPNYSDELLTSFDKEVISIIQEEENFRK